MNRFQRVIQILDDAVGGPDVGIGAHGTFWRGKTRDEFVATKVFTEDLIAVGQGPTSNLIKALRGEPPFDGSSFKRMPSGGLPRVLADDVGFIEQWIDDGCPEDVMAWRPTNTPGARRHDDIWFVTPDVGWAVNSDGKILRTVDGGATWEQQFHDPEVYFRCVGFASETRGWVGTLTGSKRLFETADGGATWKSVTNLPELAPQAVCGLSVVNESVAYAAGTNFPYRPPDEERPPAMMKTVDGGATWTAWDMRPHASLLVDTYFTTPECGWVVGGKIQAVTPGQEQCVLRRERKDVKPVVLYTEDGGATWENRVADLDGDFSFGEWGWKLFFLNDRVGFVSVENFCEGVILKTTDGGQSWRRLTINDPQHTANLEGLGFVDEMHGWVGGWGSANMATGFSSETSDGGEMWGDADEIGLFINRFRFFGDPVTVGYASGQRVYKYSPTPLPVSPSLAAAPPTRFLDNNEPAQTSWPVFIPVTIPEDASRLIVNIWDRFGAHVRHLLDEQQPPAGRRTVEWDGTSDGGEPLEAGNFIVRVTVDDDSESWILWVEQ
ncbi:MAG: YCF48-related protein [Pseudonocardiaceae bacterium]